MYDTLKIRVNDEWVELDFGVPDTATELDGMFALRYKRYSEKGYIDHERYSDGKERDAYDADGKSVYFISKIRGGRIIGTVRLIQDDPLPTRLLFDFAEPLAIAAIPPKCRAEIGRLIVDPLDQESGLYLPRNIVLLFLLKSLIRYGQEHDIQGGYAFIKTKLKDKMLKLHMPLRVINDAVLRVNEDDVLHNYFMQHDDPVIPIIFIAEEYHQYICKTIDSRMMFDRPSDHLYVLKDNLYTQFLKYLKVL